ncbi:hypothetical protein SAPIO_CDS10511 [Scedosporium apiospermum]|uniref:Carrier domain-containing protein n=1 Tax=Pseudallescheria apiosperma TaxID=563466 RepID=A0A084FVK7_PSEDA|nr:uncharacterized protein SAPIO_CDS10511 [Scedosporium apiospermum]KEZ39119.1 hypothetical protein SAPIO_CDS10511 [Scedosporium apiospermum]
MSPFSQGLQRIADISPETKQACAFQTLLLTPFLAATTVCEPSETQLETKHCPHSITGYSLVLDIQRLDHQLMVTAIYDAGVIGPKEVKSLLERFSLIVHQLSMASDSQLLSEIGITTDYDLDRLWAWNTVVPETINKCVYEILEEKARLQPTSAAICAWDGQMTYAELDRLSNYLASQLLQSGFLRCPETVVPLYFEKSKWVPVSIFGVLKAGGAFVMLDPAMPEQRLRSIVGQVEAKFAITSRGNYTSGLALCDQVIAIDDGFFSEYQSPVQKAAMVQPLPRPGNPDPSATAYVIFTSGSTGVPKGASISHKNLFSALHHQAKAIGLTSASRIYDFSAYSFDLSICNIFTSFACGGCLCIPSDADRKDNLAGSIRDLQVNTLTLTTSAAELLKPSQVPGVEAIMFLGEAVRVQDASRWLDYNVRVINTYGPCECTPISTVGRHSSCPTQVTAIGKGVGAVTWVVDPDNYQLLVPPGCIGELVLEGPVVGKGYLNNPAKTTEAFIEDPAWLVRGAPGRPGRRGRLYRTGDLVQYEADGNLRIIGRKDTMVKIRGQRVELGEVEHRLLQCIPEVVQVAAEVITVAGPNNSPKVLAAFLLFSRHTVQTEALQLYQATPEIERNLAEHLPGFMIPTFFFSIREMPKTYTGKLNRKELRELGAAFSARLADGGHGPKQQPTSGLELQIQGIWSQVLGVDSARIGSDDSFFHLGGDSIAAMRVVQEAREGGICLSVAKILRRPKLKDVAAEASFCEDNEDSLQEVAPFSLLDNNSTIDGLVSAYALDPASIQDAYPCTPLQEGLVSLSLQHHGSSVMQRIIDISHLDIELFRRAWEEVAQTNELLRTRFVHAGKEDLMQVVMDEQIEWAEATDLDEYLKADRQRQMGLGDPFVHYGLVKGEDGQYKWFVWTIHHALYDGWAMNLIADALSIAYRGGPLDKKAPYSEFIAYCKNLDISQMERFWRDTLADCECVQYPALPPSKGEAMLEQVTWTLPAFQSHRYNITYSTLIRAAWGLLAGNMTNSNDVVFGITVSGRSAPVAGIEDMAGPTFATIPFRVLLKQDQPVVEYLEEVQQRGAEMIPFEQMGVSRIAKLSPESHQACQFQTILVVQQGRPSSIPPIIDDLDDDDEVEWFDVPALVLEVHADHHHEITVTARFDSQAIQAPVVHDLLARLEFILQQFDYAVTSAPQRTIGDIDVVTTRDLEWIWKWNKNVPQTIRKCVHELVEERAMAHPDALAIHAWDGDFTYSELAGLSSKLARYLIDAGVHPGQFVPICLEKSKWAAVTMLGVMKAGACLVMLGPNLPEDRLQAMMQQVNANIILSSPLQQDLSSRLCDRVITVGSSFFTDLHNTPPQSLPQVDPASGVYTIFTSGSTGKPKCAVIGHQNLASALVHQAKTFGLDETSRVYDLSPYIFDAAIINAFHTLSVGGCLCVPTDEKSDLAKEMRNLKANWVLMPPSGSALVSPELVPDLKTIVFGGEASTINDLKPWWGKVRILNAYGPSECTPASILNNDASSPEEALSIGRGAGQVTWVVDPNNHHRLLPPGCIGELVLEGPLVGQGYLDNPKANAASYIEDPVWLVNGNPGQQGNPGVPGRRGRLYKTGDLVQYNQKGGLIFMGRKDTQVKIRGQRAELGEIELRVQEALPEAIQVVVEVITPRGGRSGPMLAAFLKMGEETTPSGDSASGTARIYSVPPIIEERLEASLPGYMVPRVFFVMNELPLTTTGKLFRKKIREIGSSFSSQELSREGIENQECKERPQSDMELGIQRIWSQILKIPCEDIGLDDSFHRLGGDSIAAIGVAAAASKEGIQMSVADILRCRTIRKLVTCCEYRVTEALVEQIAPFTLFGEGLDVDKLVRELSSQYGLEKTMIEDAYPCTPLQEGLISLASKRPGDYMMQAILELEPTVKISAFKRALEETVLATPVLRTRILQHKQFGLIQTVLREHIQWLQATGLDEYLHADRRRPVGPPGSLVRFALVSESAEGRPKWFVWTIHHALYDGWSFPLMTDTLSQAYRGKSHNSGAPFQSFIKYVQGLDKSQADAFWRSTLDNYDSAPFPTLPASIGQPLSTETICARLSMPPRLPIDVMPSALINAAWALAVRQMTGSTDIVFGTTVSGRNAPVPGLDKMPAPTFATVPFRITFDPGQTISDYLKAVQRQATEIIPYEQTGLHHISKLSPEAQAACTFQTLLVIQPPSKTEEPDPDLGIWKMQEQSQWFNPYALMIQGRLGPEELAVNMNFDPRILEPWVVQKFLRQLGHALNELGDGSNLGRTISEIQAVTHQDLDIIWDWNCSLPISVDKLVHEMVEEQVERRPNATAIHAWDGSLSYQELNSLASALAVQLTAAGVRANVLVPLCFEKSMWTPVAMLAVLKAGGAFVLLDSTLPEQRLKTITSQIEPNLILSSHMNADLSSRLCRAVVKVGPSLNQLRHHSGTTHERQGAQQPSSTTMFVVFTSGSTGAPKGAKLSHANFASGLHYQSQALGFSEDSRVFDFASYAFDIAVHNVFATLVTGGCICIPSESDRRDNVAKTMATMRVTLVDLTPTVARLIDPATVPELKTLILAGEAVTSEDSSRWWGKVRVVNAYGPAECHISTINSDPSTPEEATLIGLGFGSTTWIVDPDDHHRLVPVGCTGELLLEGPLVGQGYLNDPAKTTASFIEDPQWLLRGAPGRPGRQGRLYKTGDLVRYSGDGRLVFVGRKDAQVKLRGQRIELGEVERWVQQQMPDAEQVAVEVIEPLGDASGAILAAFIQSKGTPEPIVGPENLKANPFSVPLEVEEKLSEQLPAVMLPSAFFRVGKFPLTPTGKLNRKLLRKLGSSFTVEELTKIRTTSRGPKLQPVTLAEQQLQKIWAQILGIQPSLIGRDDSFFRLGGDSIAAMKVVGEVRKLGVELTVADLFRHPRLRDAARHDLLLPRGASGVIPRTTHAGPVEQSFAQRRLWFMDRLYPGLTWYHLPFAIRFRGPLDLAALGRALQAIENRHETLRTTFESRDDVHLQNVRPFVAWDLRVTELSSGDEQILQGVLEADQATPFDLSAEPGWRVSVYRLGKDDHVLSIVMHHIITDGWSINVLRRELAAFYSAAIKGLDPLSQVEPLPIQYKDYSAWQKEGVREDEYALQLDYWVDQLQTSRPLEFLCDKPRPATLSGEAGHRGFKIEGTLFQGLHKFCKEHEVTPFIVLLAVFRATHYRQTGVEDATLGTANANRDRWELRDIIGFFVNVQCLRIEVGNESFEDLVRHVQKTVTASFDNQDVPFERIVSQLRRGRDLSRHPIVQTIFALHSRETYAEFTLEGVESQLLDVSPGSRFDLEFHVFEEAESMQVSVVFSTDLYIPESVTGIISIFETLLSQVLEDPKSSIASFPLLADTSKAELETLGLLEINRTSYPRDSTIISIFKEQVASRSDTVAVKDSSARLTYAELDQKSDTLSAWLKKRALPAESVIAVMANRSCETIIAFLGILKAGLAYLPLNTNTPPERLSVILSSIPGQRLVLLGYDVHGPMSSLGNAIYIRIRECLENPAHSVNDNLEMAASIAPSASSLAYVVCTSGSTGEPKGVMVEHRAVIRLVKNSNVTKNLPSTGTVSHFSNIAFDATTLEVYTALLNGLTLVCIDDNVVLEPTALHAVFEQEEIRWVFITPALLKQSIQERPSILRTVDVLLIGGERFDPEIRLAVQSTIRGQMFNVYGPTENTGLSTIYSFEEEDMFPNGVPIGRPISNSGAYVMDEKMRLVPLGVVGELVVTGDGLARGYTDARRNIDRFVEVDIGGTMVRAYRTGDRVRWRPTDGQLEFFGRIDFQVKIRGQRVELGEIEHILCSHDLVDDAVALADESDAFDTRILAFVTLRSSEKVGARHRGLGRELDDHMHAYLPSYMIPQTITILDRMPVNSNGKVDRVVLLRNAPSKPKLVRSIRQPTSDVGKAMQQIWGQVLQIEPSTIGLDDNFFRLGGHSITAMKVVNEARKAGMQLTVADLFRSNTLEELVRQQTTEFKLVIQAPENAPLVDPDTKLALLSELDNLDLNIRSTDVADILPLTSMQKLYIRQSETVRRVTHYFYLDLAANIDVSRFQTSCALILEKYPMLRASFLNLLGRYWQVVPNHLEPPLVIRDVDDYLDDATDLFCRQDWENSQPSAPPVLFALVRHCGGQATRLIVRLSHAQYDGISLPFILQSILDEYLGKSIQIRTEFSTFLSYAQSRRSESIAYWKNALEGSSLASIRHKLPHNAGSPVSAQLNPKATGPVSGLQALAVEGVLGLQPIAAEAEVALPHLPGSTTPAMLVNVAWALILCQVTGLQDLAYGHVVTGRNSAMQGIDTVVGPCLTIIPFTEMGEADSLGFDDILEHCTDWPADSDFDCVLHHANIDEHPEFDFGGTTCRMQFFDNYRVANAGLSLISHPKGGHLHIKLQTNSHFTSAEVARALVDSLCNVMRKFEDGWKLPVSRFLEHIRVPE